MTLAKKLVTIIEIRPGEGRLVGLILLYAIGCSTSDLLVNTAAYALFLSDFDAQRLPYIYIGVSLCTVLISTLYLRLSQRFTLAQMLLGAHGLLLLTIIGYRTGLALTASRWLIFSLPIWYGVINVLIYIAFWNLLGRLFNLQQGKRLFGLFAAGQQSAGLVVGFLTPLLVAWIGAPNLLLIAALASGGAFWVLTTIARTKAELRLPATADTVPEAVAPDNQQCDEPRDNRRVPSLLFDPYVQLIFALFTFFALGSYFVENIFYNRVETQFPNEDQLAGFLGLFNGVNSGLSLVTQLFLVNRLLSQFGVRTAVILTPLLLLVGALLFILAGAAFGLTPLLFWLAAGMYLTVSVMNDTDNTAANLLYQPLPAELRTRVQTTADGILSPSAVGLAGLILLLLTDFFGLNALQLAYLLLPILAGWAVAGWALGRGYGRRVQQALRQRTIQGNQRFRPDRASLAILQQNLTNPHPGAVIYALDVLAAIDSSAYAHALPHLLAHPSVPVRLEALTRLEKLGEVAILPAIQECFQRDREPTVRAAALQTLAAVGGLEHVDDLDHYINTPEAPLRRSVMIGLLRSSELEAILAVGETIAHLVNSASPADRAFAAQVLGESGVISFYRPLLKMLDDPAPQVRRAALIAAGKLQQPKLWPHLVAALASAKTRAAAQSALVAGGAATLPTIKEALADLDAARKDFLPTYSFPEKFCTTSPAGPMGQNFSGDLYQARRLRCELVRVCGLIHSAQAIESLLPQLTYPDLQVRAQTLHALYQCGYRADAATHPQIEQQIQAELAHATWTLAGLVDLDEAAAKDAPGQAMIGWVRSALITSLTQQRQRLFLWLSLLYDATTLLRVRDIFGSRQGSYRQLAEEQRVYALETLDIVVDKAITKHLLPLLDDLPFAQQYARLAVDFPQPTLDSQLRLQAILTGPEGWVSPWLRAVALYSAVIVSSTAHIATVEALQEGLSRLTGLTLEPLIDETARWALRRLAISQPVNSPNNYPIAAPNHGGNDMLLTIEKVMILKTVDIFAHTPDEILVEIATLLKEINAPAGTVIFEKGATGDSMYLIVEGEVEAYDGEQVFTQMRAREPFGEMALLDGEPRTASIRTTQPTHLLRLDQEPFYELMDDRIEIAQGIIHVLLQRLRLRTNDVNRLQAELDAAAARLSK